MTTFHFETTVLGDGTLAVVLPEEFRGKTVSLDVVPKEDEKRIGLLKSNENFWRHKSLEEICTEQGGPKVCINPDDYFGSLSDLWDSPQEVEEFLKRRQEEP